MAIGSGLASQVGLKKETTYGTRVVPDKFYEFASESFNLDKNYLYSRQLRAGRTFQSSSRRAATTKQAAGVLNLEVPSKGFGALLDLLHGNAITPVQQAASIAYKQTHDIGTTDPSKSATIQVGRPDSGGTVRPFDYLGCMITDWELACDVSSFLTAALTFDIRDEETIETLATATYPTALESFNFTQGVLNIGGSAAGNVQSFTLSGGLPRKVDRFFFGSSGLKAKPIQNDYAVATATMNIEFTDLTQYARFTAGTVAAVDLTFTGSLIASTYYYSLAITLAACGFDGDTPNVDGPDVLTQSVPVVVLDNGTNPPIRIEYTSTDVTV